MALARGWLGIGLEFHGSVSPNRLKQKEWHGKVQGAQPAAPLREPPNLAVWKSCQIWRLMLLLLIVTALLELKQEDYSKFQVSLGYRVRSCVKKGRMEVNWKDRVGDFVFVATGSSCTFSL